MSRRTERAMWAAVLALAVYVAPHIVHHVQTSPAFDPPAAAQEAST